MGFEQFSTSNHLSRYAKKIALDLERKFRLVDGKKASIFSLDTSGARCSVCTDAMTGQQLISDCDVCSGTGYISAYSFLGDTHVRIDINPELLIESELGTVENRGIQRTNIMVVGIPTLKDGDVLILVDINSVYKVVDQGPMVNAIQGAVISQTLACSRITKKTREFSLIEEHELSKAGITKELFDTMTLGDTLGDGDTSSVIEEDMVI